MDSVGFKGPILLLRTIFWTSTEMSLHYLEDVSTLYPQIPTSVDETTGLLRAIESGTEEVGHLLRNSCNLILECRCCKSLFRHAKYFHKHKMSVCRAYHKPIVPTYEEILAFQREVAAMWDSEQPSTSKQIHDHKERKPSFEVVENEPYFIDSYDGIEEFCGKCGMDSPEPGEFLEERRDAVFAAQRIGSDDEIEEGEYIGWLSADNCRLSQSLVKVSDEGSDMFDQIDSSNAGESDAISLTESPVPDSHLNFPIFNDQLLESPTHTDYFGKGDKTVVHSLISTIQME